MARGTVNKVIILGRLGQDPDIRTTASGTQVANLSLATNEIGRADEQGNRQDVTEWHRVVLFGRTAELAGQYLFKGSQLYVEGRLQTRKWQDQNGNDRYSTEIIGNEMTFIGGRNDQSGGGQSFGQPQGGFAQSQPSGFGQQPQQGQAPQSMPSQPASGGFDDFDEDIPF